MTSDEIISMAKQSGAFMAITMSSPPGISSACFAGAALERFAALVAASEREACAKVCERLAMSENAALKADVALLHAEIMALEQDEADLRNQVANRDAQIARQHEEILHLMIYAPGRNVARELETIKQIAETNWPVWGIKETESN